MRLSLQTLRLLHVFLEAPAEPRYGLELMKRTGIKSGTIYPALHRLENEGWLRSFTEELDPVRAGRPARRLYALTDAGAAAARAAAEPFQTPAPAPTLKPRTA